MVIFPYCIPSNPWIVGIHRTGTKEQLVVTDGFACRTLYEVDANNDAPPYDKRIRWFAPSPNGQYVAILISNGQTDILRVSSGKLVASVGAINDGGPYIVQPTWTYSNRLAYAERASRGYTDSFNYFGIELPTLKQVRLGPAQDIGVGAFKFLGWKYRPGAPRDRQEIIAAETITNYLNPKFIRRASDPAQNICIEVTPFQIKVTTKANGRIQVIHVAKGFKFSYVQAAGENRLSATEVRDSPEGGAIRSFGGQESVAPWFSLAYLDAKEPRTRTLIFDLRQHQTRAYEGIAAGLPINR
jgi:hypothetical protein